MPRPHSPGRKPKTSLPGTVKDEVDTKARELIETVLKPKHVQPPKDDGLNHVIDISIKWFGLKCYFVSTYCNPGPGTSSPTFEIRFARLTYVGDGTFALSFQ